MMNPETISCEMHRKGHRTLSSMEANSAEMIASSEIAAKQRGILWTQEHCIVKLGDRVVRLDWPKRWHVSSSSLTSNRPVSNFGIRTSRTPAGCDASNGSSTSCKRFRESRHIKLFRHERDAADSCGSPSAKHSYKQCDRQPSRFWLWT